MQKLKAHIFLIYSLYAAAFFVAGVLLFYLLPEGNFIYLGVSDGIYRNISSNTQITFSSLASTFAREVKYIIFIFAAVFTAKRHFLFISLLSFKGFLTGAGIACFMRELKCGVYNTVSAPLVCFVYTVISVSALCVLIYFCGESLWFSKKLIYPPKFKSVVKRKDSITYLFLFFALCGVLLLITIIKHGNLMLMISPKG